MLDPIRPGLEYSLREHPHLMGPLAGLYEWEALEVNKRGEVARGFDVSWERSELPGILEQFDEDGSKAEELFQYMEENRRLVPLSGGRYRTDTCETVRLSTFNYGRFFKENQPMVPTQAGVSWRVERKMTPVWEMSMPEIVEELRSEFEGGALDEDGNRLSYEDPARLTEATRIVLESFEWSLGFEARLSGFQFRSIRGILRGAIGGGLKTQVIKAGTGSGKSYGFQLGVLISLVYDLLSDRPPTKDTPS